MTQSLTLDYTYSEQLVREICDTMVSYFDATKKDEIEKIIWDTYVFARDAHGEQKRKSGEPYITHPLEAAKLLLELKPDIVSIQSCILHDVIEDTESTFQDIEKKF